MAEVDLSDHLIGNLVSNAGRYAQEWIGIEVTTHQGDHLASRDGA